MDRNPFSNFITEDPLNGDVGWDPMMKPIFYPRGLGDLGHPIMSCRLTEGHLTEWDVSKGNFAVLGPQHVVIDDTKHQLVEGQRVCPPLLLPKSFVLTVYFALNIFTEY